jgi:toxin YoeB
LNGIEFAIKDEQVVLNYDEFFRILSEVCNWMRSISFEGDTWQCYEALRIKDKPLHQVLYRILKEMQRGNPAEGSGKPEPLRHSLSGLWSRRLSKKG